MALDLSRFFEHRIYKNTETVTAAGLRDVRAMVCGRELLETLRCAVQKGLNITVYGDYDADGVMASYILTSSLAGICSGRVEHFTNDRFEDGYGITPASIGKCLEKFPGTDLIITCDNGINAAEAVSYAMEKGVTVLVTDHHEQIIPLPEGCRALDEKSFAQKAADADSGTKPEEFCGAELARRVVFALYGDLGIADKYSGYLESLFAYSAFATIADSVPMNAANHFVGRKGLHIIREGRGIWGTLRDEYSAFRGFRSGVVHWDTIGFIYAPMINACSRVRGSADAALEMLFASAGGDEKNCRAAARRLIELNEERKRLSEHDDRVVFGIIKDHGYENDPFILICDDRLSEGVNGLTSAHITERFHVPSAVLSPVKGNADVFKGSARSVPGFDLVSALTSHGGLIRAGGHPMAAGLQINREDIEKARELLRSGAESFTPPPLPEADLLFTPDTLTLADVEEIKKITDELEPFGPGFEEPRSELAAKASKLWSMKDIHAKYVLGISADRRYVNAIWWNKYREAKETFSPGAAFVFRGKLEANEFGGSTSIQMILDSPPRLARPAARHE